MRSGIARQMVLLLAGLWSGAAAAQTVVHTQDFNSSISPWQKVLPANTTADWSVVSSGSYPGVTPYEGARMAQFNSYNATSGDEAWIYSPSLDLTGAEVAECRFWMYQDNGYSGYSDQLTFLYSLDGNVFYPMAQFNRYGSSNGWVERVIPLGYYTTQPAFYIGLLGTSGNGNDIYVDYLRVTKSNLAAGADGKDCTTGTDCNSGICGVDPGGNKRCRPSSAACIDGNRQPVGSGTVTCYGPDKASCNGTDQWSVQSCANDCGAYQDVHACGMGQCIACDNSCDPFTNEGCDPTAYCAWSPFPFSQCFSKKNNGQACGANGECLSGNCVASPGGTKYCEQAGTPCAANDGSAVLAGAATCQNNDRWICQNAGGWQSQDCAQNCGFYKDVDQCSGGICASCATSCNGDPDCKGVPCTNHQCVGNLANGATCLLDTQCASSHCIDSRCCQDVCTAPCYRCDVGSQGVCLPIPAGQDPDGECRGDGSACKGSCNGQGSCQWTPQGTVCATCARCDGSGSCRLYVPAMTDPNNECPPCQSCNGSAPGCLPVPAGQDPLDDCTQQSPSGCGLDGDCDGQGSCRFWALNTECQPGACSNGTATFPSTCDGQGRCVNRGSGTCGLYRCADTIHCATSCNSHAICLTEAFCSTSGTCQPDLGEGAACDVVYPGLVQDAACTGGYCFQDNFDGQGAFCTSNAAACVHDGVTFNPGYALCSPDGWFASCLGGAKGWGQHQSCAAGLCDAGGGPGSGFRAQAQCVSGPGGGCSSPCTSCEPYLAASESSCRTDCANEQQCWTGYTCQGGACKVPEGIGNPCTTQANCTAGICTDGRCCLDACTGPCRSCNLPGKAGFCTLAPAGTDPDNECDARPASTCATTGVCDGHGACALWPVGQKCGDIHCAGTSLIGEGDCDGVGDCVPGAQTDCWPGKCVGAACVSSCNSHQDCDPGGFCGADHHCLADLADGGSCQGVVLPGLDADAACRGGYCFDDSFNESGAYCASQIDACVAAGSVYPPGFRLCRGDAWYRLCLGGTDGWGNQVNCAAAGVCDAGGGAGTGVQPAEKCIAGPEGGCESTCQSCYPFRAQGSGTCKTACAEQADCWPGLQCSAGKCLPSGGLGAACQTSDNCTGWTCVNSVCCNLPCDGPCRLCNDPVAPGVCLNAVAGPDPTGKCTQDDQPCGSSGLCDGAGDCTFKPAGSECATGNCSGGVRTSPSFCDGKGKCVAGRNHPCPSGACQGDQCAPGGVDGGPGDGDGGPADGGDGASLRPVAEAGTPQRVAPGALVTLDGTKSYDLAGEELTYLWKQSSGPESVELSGSTTPRPSFKPRLRGVYVFQLVVSDSRQESTPDFTEVSTGEESGGCGCAAGAPADSLATLLLVGLWTCRRRRR